MRSHRRLPPSVADEMVEMLVGDATLLSVDTVLCPGSARGTLLAALDRFVDRGFAQTFPEVVVVERGPAAARDVASDLGRDGIDVRDRDFLARGPELPDCEYVLSAPPSVAWQRLDVERRREYAALLSQLRADDPDADGDALFIERALQFLTADGRGVFLTDTDLKSGAETAAFRERLVPLLGDIEQVAPEPHDGIDESKMLTVVTSESSPEFDIDGRVHQAPPATVEAQLLAGDGEDHRVEAAMTPLRELDVYAGDDDATAVYMDMFYEDYDASLVYDAPDAREGLEGYIARTELAADRRQDVAAFAAPIPPDRCLAPTDGIGRLIELLGEVRFCFVGTPERPAGLATRFDLNRLPVYRYLYGRFARFEVGLRGYIRTGAPGWAEAETSVHLPGRGTGDVVSDRLANGSLHDLVTLLEELQLASGLLADVDDADATLEMLVELRNAVAHYNPLVHVMSDADTGDDIERGARQLAAEHRLLVDCIDRLGVS